MLFFELLQTVSTTGWCLAFCSEDAGFSSVLRCVHVLNDRGALLLEQNSFVN